MLSNGNASYCYWQIRAFEGLWLWLGLATVTAATAVVIAENMNEANKAVYRQQDGSSFAFMPKLDTRHLDLMEEDAFDHFAFLVWRLVYHPDQIDSITLLDKMPLLAKNEPPHPDECGRCSVALERIMEKTDG